MKANFGGKELVGFTELKWTIRAGVFPSIELLPMAPADATTFDGNPGPHTLSIQPDQGPPIQVENLYVLKIMPGSSPFEAAVMVADRRWMWSLWHLGPRRYNKRRATGVKRVIDNAAAALPFDTAPQLAYADYSMDKGKPWTAKRVLENALDALKDKDRASGGTGFTYTIQGSAVKSSLPVEELEIDDQADQAIARILAYFPGTDCYVDYRGNVVVYNKADGGEQDIVKRLAPEICFEGHTEFIKNNNVRPREIRVGFTREIEWWLTFTEAASTGSTVTAGPPGTTIANVLPLPDYHLQIGADVINQGTWVQLDAACRAWGNLPLRGATRTLDHDLIQRAFIPHMDLWAALTISGQRPDERDELRDWVSRIAAVQTHYRRTFKLEKELVDKCYDIRACRVATIDPQTGQRAPASAYGDYCIVASQRMIWKRRNEGGPLDYAINRTAFPADGKLGSVEETSPAIVTVLDADQGIIHVDYVVDPNRTYEMILPSLMDSDGMPCADITNKRRNITFDSIIEGTTPPKLSASFRLGIVLTVVPASPNTEDQLHWITVKPKDIEKLLPNPVGACVGPIMEIRVGAGTEVARVQYLDDRLTDLQKAVGLLDGKPNMEGLVINEGAANQQGGASLNNIAQAHAAAVYAALTDRQYGETTGYLNPVLELKGYTSTIEHRVELNAAATTKAVFPEDIPQMSFFSYLGSSDRATILKLVRP